MIVMRISSLLFYMIAMQMIISPLQQQENRHEKVALIGRITIAILIQSDITRINIFTWIYL